MQVTEFTETMRFRAPITLLEAARSSAIAEGQSMSEFVRESVRRRIKGDQ